MFYTLKPFSKRILPFALSLLTTAAVSAHSFPNSSAQDHFLSDDTSKHKSSIFKCANFGQVRSIEQEAGGISGCVDAAELKQCFNTGNIHSSQKAGGVAGHASGNSNNPSAITYCFNSGQIHGQDNSGGIVGYLNQHISVCKAYNTGNVEAETYAGALVGRKFNAKATISDCYYDRQTCLKGGIENQDIAKSAEGRLTTQMLADSLSSVLDASQWKFNSNYYPRLHFLDTFPAVLGAVSPILLQKDERIDSIASPFRMQQTKGLHWSVDDSSSIRISGDLALILKKDSNRMISIGDGIHTFRQIPLLHTYPQTCRKIALHANQGSGNMDTLIACGNEKTMLPKPAFTRQHYIFMGWGFSPSAPNLQSGDSIYFSSDTVLYAVWSPDGKDAQHAATIESPSEFIAFRNAVNNNKGVYKGIPNASTGYKNIHFRLTTDIDLDSLYKIRENWEPIGKSSTICFRGNFHGEKHRISHLYINAPTASYKGLFGYIDSALIENVILSTNDSIIGKQYCGGIAAYANNKSIVRGCANHAYIEGKSTHVGGICGNIGKSAIEDCFNTGCILGDEKVGGISGYTNGNSNDYANISCCYNSGQIRAKKAGGGIAGNSYSYTHIYQVLHSGQVWSDTLGGSIIGQKSQKSVTCTYGYYDRQISPVGGINNTDDSSASGICTKELCDGKLPRGFDSLYWESGIGLYPRLRSADSSMASRIAIQPIRLASNDDIRNVRNDFDLSGCDTIQWTSSSDSLYIHGCKGNILGKDTQIVLSAMYQKTIYKQIYLSQIYKQKMYRIQLLANDSLNSQILRYAYESSYFHFDTLPFQKAHQIFRGWSGSVNGKAELLHGDSALIVCDTSFYAVWSNDGLSADYALGIDSLGDWTDFRNAVNDYNGGCYKGVLNHNTGFRGTYFSLNTPLNLQTICDSLHPWIPIGKNSSCNFKGNFNGNGNTVDYLVIDSADMDYAGIFGCIDSAVISDVELGQHSYIRAHSYLGGIAACARKQSLIKGCANHADIYGYGEYIGGIAGYLSRSSIEECYNAADICGKAKVGGIVGYAGTASTGEGSASNSSSRISYCYNSNTISGNECTGGLIGFLNGNTTLIKAYNSGQLFGKQFTGSVVGRKYSSTPFIESCFYDKQTSTYGSVNGKDEMPNAMGISTKKMTHEHLKEALDSIHWKYAENFYPQLSRFDSSKLAWISVVPIFLEETDRCDRVTHDFQLGSYANLSWESSKPQSLQINEFKACILDSDTVCLTAVCDKLVKKRYRIIQHFMPSEICRIESEKELSFHVYPNPTQKTLYIQARENFGKTIQSLRLYDASGKQLLQEDVREKKAALDLSRLPHGSYLLYIVDNKGKVYNYRVLRR